MFDVAAADEPVVRRALTWAGFTAHDVEGRKLGHVVGPVVDRATGKLLWLLLELQDHGRRRIVVPADGVVAGAGHVMVPHRAEVLRRLTAASPDEAMTPRGEQLATGPFTPPIARPPAPWERRRVTALASLDADGRLIWEPGPREAGSRVHPPRLRVVIADDNPGYCALLQVRLEGRGDVEVAAVAHTGAEAIAAIRDARPDMAIVDLDLPDMVGLDVFAATREHTKTRFLILSGHDRLGRFVDAEVRGRGVFMSKSAGVEEILHAIDSRGFSVA